MTGAGGLSGGLKVAGYVAALAVVLGAAVGVGSLIHPLRSAAATPAGHGEHGETATSQTSVAGLAINDHGYTLQLIDGSATGFSIGVPGKLQFRIIDGHGMPVTDYAENHERDLHLIVVNRNLSGYQHLHPELAADGTWSVPITFAAAGIYRAIADFTPAGATQVVLGADVLVTGEVKRAAAMAVSDHASVDGYEVKLNGQLVAGQTSSVALTVSKGGNPVTDLQPYLGAAGHLVALRAGDLGYVHVHPTSTGSGPQVEFAAEVPSAGTYQLYFDFQHGGTVRTAEFTVIAGGAQ